jgi:hypothetical protein
MLAEAAAKVTAAEVVQHLVDKVVVAQEVFTLILLLERLVKLIQVAELAVVSKLVVLVLSF